MQLEIFTLCDAATEHAGKLNIIGTFDALRALEAPIAHPQCAIAGRLRFEQIEEGDHRVSLIRPTQEQIGGDGRRTGSSPSRKMELPGCSPVV